jgi:hypothetical protein
MFNIVEHFHVVVIYYVLFIWAQDFLGLVKFCGTVPRATLADLNRICGILGELFSNQC